MSKTTIDPSLTPNVLPLTGGTLSGTVSMGSNKITSLSNGTAASDATAFGQIKIIQTVTATHSSDVSTDGGSGYIDSGITATITPSSSSNKIRILVCGNWAISAGNAIFTVRLVRGSTTVKTLNYAGGSSGAAQGTFTLMYDDSPATTSATTYKIQFNNAGGGGLSYIYDSTSGPSQILLEEIAG
jgi:hypothetical protein